VRIIVAETAGFCWGVQRAIDQALSTAKSTNGPVYTHGPLIHNTQVVDELRRKNIQTLEGDVENASDGTLVIRAHGIRPDELKNIKNKHSHVVDATCPLVTKVHRKIARHQANGYKIYIMGEKQHPEVLGLMGTAQDQAVVIPPDPEEVKKLPDHLGKICLVSQTTQNDDIFKAVEKELRSKCEELLVENTICHPTRSHQSETMDMAASADMIVVVGGKHSANTRHLAELAASLGPRVVHVETDTELNPDDFKGVETVGVTAGASTPQWMIRRVVDRLETFNSHKGYFHRAFRTFLDIIIPSNIYSTMAFASIFSASSYFVTGSVNLMQFFSAVLVVFGIHNFNEYGPSAGFDRRSRFSPVVYERFRRGMLVISSFSILCGLCAGMYYAINNFVWPGILFITSAGGIVYGKQLVPDILIQKLGFKSIRDLPGAKDLSISFGWTLLFSILPLSLVSFSADLHSVSLLLFLFLSVYRRSAIMGVRDVQGDRIVGMESTFKFMGKAKAKKLLLAIDFLSMIFIGIFIFRPEFRVISAIPVFLCFVMGVLFSYLYRIRRLPQEIESQFLLDSQFVIPGIAGAAIFFWTVFIR